MSGADGRFGSLRPAPSSRNIGRLIRRPIVLLGLPRSGTSTLMAMLSTHPALWSLHRESTHIVEDLSFHPMRHGWSHELSADDLDESARRDLERRFYREAGNLEVLPFSRFAPVRGRGKRRAAQAITLVSRPFRRPPIRIVEKSVPNVMRIMFLRELFPDAQFLHLTRHPRANLAAMYRGWNNTERHNDYPLPDGFRIVGYEGNAWAFFLPPRWQSCDGRTLMDVCELQWRMGHERCLAASNILPAGDYLRLKFEDLLVSPTEALGSVASWAGIDPAPFDRFSARLPRINAGSSSSSSEVPGEALARAVEELEPLTRRLGYE
ncbi:MAG: sulfotransferase [Actinomycetota bacterium]|nr:sulfotransferase [Actinomycetota bacterium]